MLQIRNENGEIVFECGEDPVQPEPIRSGFEASLLAERPWGYTRYTWRGNEVTREEFERRGGVDAGGQIMGIDRATFPFWRGAEGAQGPITREVFDQVLREVYVPAVQEMLAQPNALTRLLEEDE